MTQGRTSGTDRAFTVVVCTGPGGAVESATLDGLRATVRRCAHGMLVSTPALLAPIYRTPGSGEAETYAMLQPCDAHHRAPVGPARWVGPIRTADDAVELAGWVERGGWSLDELPRRLHATSYWSARAAMN